MRESVTKIVLHIIIFEAMATMLLGCESVASGMNDYRPSDNYCIAVNFKDFSGKDLVAPLEEAMMNTADSIHWVGGLNPEKYHLEIILSNPHESWDNTIYNAKARKGYYPIEKHPYFSLIRYNESDGKAFTKYGHEGYDIAGGYCYLFSDFFIPAINGMQNTLIYKISCPTIFGDELLHDIETRWDEDTFSPNDSVYKWGNYYECKGASFEGNIIAVKKIVTYCDNNRDYYCYLIDIILDQ